MQQIGNLLPQTVGSQAPAKQESTQLKTGEEEQFLDALRSAPVRKAHLDLIKEVLRYAMVKVGLRSQNWPQDEEKALLLTHIQQEYGNHTVAEIRLAFDLAIAGKLELLQGESVNCYENFSCLYFSSIMNAYRRWAVQAHRQIVKPAMIEPPKEDLSDTAMQDWVNSLKQTKPSVDFMPEMLYDWLIKKKILTPTKKEKWESLARAAAYRQYQLYTQLQERPNDKDLLNAYLQFIKMKDKGEIIGDEAKKVMALAKKIITHDYILKENECVG
jgi:hypothetical protein